MSLNHRNRLCSKGFLRRRSLVYLFWTDFSAATLSTMLRALATAHTDTYNGRFVEFVANERVVEIDVRHVVGISLWFFCGESSDGAYLKPRETRPIICPIRRSFIMHWPRHRTFEGKRLFYLTEMPRHYLESNRDID
jgi:hypothetical protein